MRVQHSAAFVTDDKAEITSGWRILRVMVKNIWPKDKPALKARVLAAVGFLVGSKVWLYLLPHFSCHTVGFYSF